MPLAIKVENVSKAYQLGEFSSGTLSRDLERWWALYRGKEDPFLKVGETNDRAVKGNSDIVWSLKDLNFEIQQGDAVGIIGKNGAGKSTLLKVLSQVTSPTTGNIKVKGRIASLLEVGTGFHPELTGRENIYLNGAILGMRKSEITRKLDEIIDFSGVERYVDTPVKRYSSGMYVRLAFAVAAHLESEILIVDEVLAVGDAEFQRKCLGKMGEVSKGEGRTVLFVSHNMGAVKNLCNKGFLFRNGILAESGNISHVIDRYFYNSTQNENGIRKLFPENQAGYFSAWKIVDKPVYDFTIYSEESFKIEFTFEAKDILKNVEFGLVIRNSEGQLILGCNSRDFGRDYLYIEKGCHKFSFDLQLPIKHGEYEIDIAIVQENRIIDQWVSPTMLTVKNKFESVLGEKWTGLLNITTAFRHERV